MGVDQSYTSCGYCVIDTQKNVKHFGVIRTDNASLDVFERSWIIATSLCKLATDLNVNTVAIEGLAFAKFGNATRDLAGLQFTIYNQLSNVALTPVEIVAPTILKKFATGKGKASKPDMLAAMPTDVIKQMTDAGFMKTKGLYDLADAYWLALFSLEHSQKTQKKQTT